MKLERPHTLTEIAELIGAHPMGSANHLITGLNEIHVVEPGDLVFVDHPKYYDKALASAATTILINKKVEHPEGKALLVSEDPFRDYNWLTRHFRPFRPQNAAIAATAQIGPDTLIQPNVTIGNHVKIGSGCIIHPGVVIYDHCEIGNHVTLHGGTIIGSDAFYFQKQKEGFRKMHSCGRVIIGNHVEIGSNCTIDKGVSGDTIIGDGCKIDNLVQIGHDTILGTNCLIAAQVGIAGCCRIENDVTMWGQAGVPANIHIGKGAVLLGKSAPSRNLEGGKSYLGAPCEEARVMWKQLAAIRKLPIIIENL